ncbi:MAG TPA: glycosyltransferase [Candidatus Dormibacteraeota bacterium]|nr:glycosyltransferase [Candidatus Dormibacteraeota bacterium]
MKLLWVKSGGLVPLDTGGKIRSFHLLRELAREHSTDLFTFYAAHPGDEHDRLSSIFHRVNALPLSIPEPRSWGDYFSYAINLFSIRPYSMKKYCRPEAAAALRELLRRNKYDIIICDFFLTGGVIPWGSGHRTLLFTHNVEAQIWQRHYQVSRNPIWRAISWREYKTIARLERRFIQAATFVLTVSENDRNAFSAYVPKEKMAVVETGVDVDYFRPTPYDEQPYTLVFTGSMDWTPNEDGIVWFVEDVLPLIRQDIPKTEVIVVGRRPSKRLLEIGQTSGIQVTGGVDDIRPYLAKGAVYIVPLRIGGGTRIKIFEAMASGKAVVSTSIGAEGLPVTNHENIILADEAKNFAGEVVAHLRNNSERRRLGQAARELVEKNYSWASVAKRFSEVLERVSKI